MDKSQKESITENSYIVSAKQLMVDVNEHLDEVE